MFKSKIFYVMSTLIVAAATFFVAWILLSIRQHKQEELTYYFKLVDITDDTVDPALWGKNFPRQYDGYKRTVDTVRTKHGGSEAYQRLVADPRLKRIFAGYAFGTDYREERGHAFSLFDQDETKRVKLFPQFGACLHCHAGGIASVYTKAGGGDMIKGFLAVNKMPLKEARKLVQHPVACVDCHDPQTMHLRVTRPGFMNAMKDLKKSEGVENYDVNKDATRQEMRAFVCGQCHVEYYFKGKKEKVVTYPWSKGLKMEEIESYYDEEGWKDWVHKETGAPVLKAHHPEFEMWNQGIHARSGVACADCHMPYMREGAIKISDHHVRSPLLNIARACQQCHSYPENEILTRALIIQDRTANLLSRAEDALIQMMDAILAAKKRGATDADLKNALALHRKAQWRMDFVNAENSMGFHAPQEAARILGEAIDYARQGEILAMQIKR